MAPNKQLATKNAYQEVRNSAHPQWWRDPGLKTLNFLLIGPMLSSVCFGFDSTMIGGLLANKRWFKDLNISGTSLLGLVIAASQLGALGCLFPAAYLVDKIGRRRTCIGGCIILIGGVIAQALSDTHLKFLGTRIVIGFVGTGVNVAASILVAELTHPRQRAQITSLWFTFFYVGGITVSWTAYGALNIESSWTWRLPVIMQALWNAIQLPILYFCPESPRWLAMKGRYEEAKHILAKYHANGDLDDELVELEYQEIVETIGIEKSREGNSWLALFKTKANIKRTALIIFLGLASQWVGNGIVSYYFVPILQSIGISDAKQQQGINGGLQIFNWLMAIGGALCSEKVGRRTLLIASACGMLVFMVLVTVCSAVYAKTQSTAAGTAVIAFLFLFFGSYDVGFTPIPPLYVAELAPSSLRAKCVALYWFTTAVALCFNQYVNPIALAAIAWKYYLVYVAVLVGVITGFFFFAPETKGLTLEEVAGLFEDDAAAATAHAVEVAKHMHDTDNKEQISVEVEERVQIV